MGWMTEANLRGLPGYNASGVAEEIDALARFAREDLGPNKFADALRSGFTPHGFAAERLDIWAEFNEAGGGESWKATNYGEWIAGVNQLLGPFYDSGVVARTNRGLSSNGVDAIYSYTVGTGPVHALILGGVHANERAPKHALIRFVEQLAKSSHPQMVALRKLYRITVIPMLTPGSYNASRTNPNGVDVNRNSDFYWAQYSSSDPANNKGAAPFDQAETRVVRDIVANENVEAFIDLHGYGSSSTDCLLAGLPSSWALGRRSFPLAVMDAFRSIYRPPLAVGMFGDVGEGAPHTHSWASFYMHHVRNRRTAVSGLLECAGNIGGSTGPRTTREGVRLINGYLTLFLLMADQDRTAPTPAPYELSALLDNENPNALVSAGGTRITENTDPELSWTAFVPSVNSAKGKRLKVVTPYPCVIIATVTGYLESGGSAEQVDLKIGYNGRTFLEHGLVSATTPATEYQRVPFSVQRRIAVTSVDAKTVHEFSLVVNKPVANTGFARIKRAILQVRVAPNTIDQPVPLVNIA